MEKVLGRMINPSLHEIYLGYVNAFLMVASDGSLILVDSGMPNSHDKIIKYINSIGKSVNDLKFILLTHSHLDHIGSVYYLKKMTNAKVAINNEGIKYVDGSAGLRIPKARDLKGRLLVFLIRMSRNFMKPKFFKPEMVLKEGAFPKEFNLNARIIETPGHTNDSISIYMEDSKTLICGDLFDGTSGGLNLPEFFEDYIGWLNSAKKIKELNPDLICVGHGKNYSANEIKV